MPVPQEQSQGVVSIGDRGFPSTIVAVISGNALAVSVISGGGGGGGGNVTQGTTPWVIQGNLSSPSVAVTFLSSQFPITTTNPLVVAGNLSAPALAVTIISAPGGGISVTQGTTPWIVQGNLSSPSVAVTFLSSTFPVTQSTNPWIVAGNLSAPALAVTIISTPGGGMSVTQGTSPWVVSGNLSAPALAVTIISTPGGGMSVTQGTNPWVIQSNLSNPAVAVTILSAGGGTQNLATIGGQVITGQSNSADAVATVPLVVPVNAYQMAWNSSGWDRIRDNSGITNAVAIPAGAPAAFIWGMNPGNSNAQGPIGASAGSFNQRVTNLGNALSTIGAVVAIDSSDTGFGYPLRAATGSKENTLTPGGSAVLAVNTEGTRPTYSAGIANAAFSAASGTDVFLINGSASAVVRILRAEISFTSLLPVNIPMQFSRRSAVTTAGTSGVVTSVKNDTSNAAASAVVVNYTNTAAQVPGTPLGPVRAAMVAATLASAGSATSWVVDFTTRNGQGMLLRGTSDVFALTLSSGGQTTGTSNISASFEWSESTG